MKKSSYEKCEFALRDLLEDESLKVVALSGAWGTGKTHLLKKICSDSTESKKRQIVFSSLFGLKGTQELRLKLLYAASKGSDQPKTAVANLVDGLLKKFTGLTATEFALLGLPSLLKGKLVVVDDVERKNKSFDIDEFLGFIDELSQLHDVRFLLLLNTGKLADKDIWETLHEKAIDGEVVLSPLPGEVFDLAKKTNNEIWHSEALRALTILGITNIRVARRAMSIVDSVANLGAHTAPNRWVPSAILMACAHFRALNNGLTLNYIRKYRPFMGLFGKDMRTQEEKEWDETIRAVGYPGAGQFEESLSKFLCTGVLEKERFSEIFTRFQTENTINAAEERFKEFSEQVYWGAKLDENDLRRMADDLRSCVPNLSPASLTYLVDILDQLDLRDMSDEYLELGLKSIGISDIAERIRGGSYFPEQHLEQLHEKIKLELKRISNEVHPEVSLVDAVVDYVKSGRFETYTQEAVAKATLEKVKEALLSLSGSQLADFINGTFGLADLGGSGSSARKAMGEALVSACSDICEEVPESRIAEICLRILKSRKLDSPKPEDGDQG